MPEEKRYDSAAERQRAYRERKRNAGGPGGVTPDAPIVTDEPVTVDPGVTVGPRSIERLLKLDPFAPLSDEEEHVLRVHFGYAASESRTRAERQPVGSR
jgi:hypothetical protein